MPVAMVITCEASSNGIHDISSPSLLFDSDTPVPVLQITKSRSSNSQANSMATEQDSVNTIPDTVEDDRHVNCSDVSTGPTAECNGENVTLDDTDNISVADSNDCKGETPSSDNTTVNSSLSDVSSCSHLLDHSYTALHNGVGGADSLCEQLKCQESMEKYSAMVTPLTGKASVLLKDNGCHAARCSAIKRSNRRLARARRQATSLLSNRQRKKAVKDQQISTVEKVSSSVKKVSPPDLTGAEESGDRIIHVTPSMSTENDSDIATSDNTVATMVDSVTKSVDIVTKTTSAEQTVTQIAVAVTQSVDKVPQTMVAVTQSMDMMTQSADAVTQTEGNKQLLDITSKPFTCSHSTITWSQPGGRACSVTNSDFRVKATQFGQNVMHVTKDTPTHQKDVITQSAERTTYLQRPAHTMPHYITSNSNSFVANTQSVVRYNQHHNVPTAPLQAVWPPDLQYLQQYHNLLKQLAIGSMTTAISHMHGKQLPSVSDQLERRPSLVTSNASTKVACLYGMLSSCLATSDYTVPSLSVTTSTPATPHVASSSHRLPMIQNVFSNVNTQFPYTSRQLPVVIRQRQPAVFAGALSLKDQPYPLTTVVPSNVVTSPTNVCSRFRSIQNVKSPLITVLTSVDPSPVMSAKPMDTVTITTVSNSNHTQPVISSDIASTNLSSVTSLTGNSSSVSVSSPSVTDLTSTNSSGVSFTSVSSPTVATVTTLMSSVNSPCVTVNSPTVSLTSVSFPSVTSLTSTNSSKVSTTTPVNSQSDSLLVTSSCVSLTSVNSPSVMSLTSVNSPVHSSPPNLTLFNSPSVASLTSANSPNISLILGNSESVVSVSSPSVTVTVASASITSVTSVDSPNVVATSTSLMSVNSPDVIATSAGITSLTSISSPSVIATSPNLKSVSDAAHVTSNTSNEGSHDALKHTTSSEEVEVSSSDSPATSVAIETVSQAVPEGNKSSNPVTSVAIETVSEVVPEGDESSNSGKQSTTESPPHTPTGGILKRVSQFDTPTISGKVRFHFQLLNNCKYYLQRRRVSFADTVENHENYSDGYGDRRYVTSPRSKLHCKTILLSALFIVCCVQQKCRRDDCWLSQTR